VYDTGVGEPSDLERGELERRLFNPGPSQVRAIRVALWAAKIFWWQGWQAEAPT
jgi:hypothetical protein